VWTGILLSVFQQFVGINVIFYYSATLWHAVGFTHNDSLAITVITSVTNIIVTLVAIALVDRLGRKPLLIVGSLGMALTLGVIAWVFGTAPTVMAAGHAQPQLGPAASPQRHNGSPTTLSRKPSRCSQVSALALPMASIH
jgi:MFS family permease